MSEQGLSSGYALQWKQLKRLEWTLIVLLPGSVVALLLAAMMGRALNSTIALLFPIILWFVLWSITWLKYLRWHCPRCRGLWRSPSSFFFSSRCRSCGLSKGE